MNTKRIWLILPAVLMPYIVLGTLAIIFVCANNSAMQYLMETVFHNNALALVGVTVIYTVIALILSIVCFGMSVYKCWDAVSLAKTAMIIKLIQIPAYILIFVLALLFMITIFTIPFTLALFVLDYITLIMTGLITCAAIIVAIRQKSISFKDTFWLIILQFFFCADVIASILLYIKLKEQSKTSDRV